MKELKAKAVVIDRDITIPGDGSTKYAVFKKTGENTWESCGELIENEGDALLYAAAPELLNVAELALESQGWDGNNPDDDRWTNFYAQARSAIEKAGYSTIRSLKFVFSPRLNGE